MGLFSFDAAGRISRDSQDLSFATKYRSSKMVCFSFVMKTVLFPMFVRISTQFAETQMFDKGC